ncbi:MAG: PQQ-dependent dehydrogenase, methanol/ethanol family [Candidatus Rokuibacteriota bacterium]|nr:MAG: PQQ-dependent dehydrogenase, methanol/ethanol family [Candidatus Rokubacteria bacterium]
MSLRKTLIALGVVVALLGLAVIGIQKTPGLDWRARVVLLKLRGQIVDLSWGEMLRMLRPGSGYYLQPMVLTGSAYSAIANPFVSESDIAAGATIFRSRCGLCHGSDARGGAGPSLRRGRFDHGDSDWHLFRVVSRGIPGTAMEPQRLSERETWQVLAFVRSLTADAKGQEARPSVTWPAPVTYERLLRAELEPASWLTYSGGYASQRHSRLRQVNRTNVKQLQLRWARQVPAAANEMVEATPLVADGVMYVTQPPDKVLALDADTGHILWSYRRDLPGTLPLCCYRSSRGVALLGDRVYVGTLDAHLVALDGRTGTVVWDVAVGDPQAGYSITGAPLAVKGNVIVGVGGGEFGIRGFLDAYDATTGKRAWRFYTVPAPGERVHETWSGASWKTGGAPTWLTGSFDPDSNVVYWGVGNPSPPYQGDERAGDNLYSNSVVAVDADTGTLKWHFQFTPHDEHDWDSCQIPVLVDRQFGGTRRRLMVWPNRNGFYYVLDRETGQFLLAREFATQSWADGISPDGRPRVKPGSSPSAKGTLVYPGLLGGSNWWSPAYNPDTGLLYVPTMERGTIFFKGKPHFTPGAPFAGSAWQAVSGAPYRTAVRALSVETGELQWEYKPPERYERLEVGGLLSTAGDVIFGGDLDVFFALDARTGRVLWRAGLGGIVHAAPVTYLSKGRQQVTIAAAQTLFTFALPAP